MKLRKNWKRRCSMKHKQMLSGSAAKPATQGEDFPAQVSAPGSTSEVAASAAGTLKAFFGESRPGQRFALPAGLALPQTSGTARLQDLLRKLKNLQGAVPPGLIQDALTGIPLLAAWQSVRHPPHAVRNAMAKHASKVWRVPRRKTKFSDQSPTSRQSWKDIWCPLPPRY